MEQKIPQMSAMDFKFRDFPELLKDKGLLTAEDFKNLRSQDLQRDLK